MIKIIKRLLANIIDVFVFFGIFIGSFMFVNPILIDSLNIDASVAAGAILVFICLATFALHYPFMTRGQTIGKGFFGLRIVPDEEHNHDVSVKLIIVREIFGKVMPVYLLCIPVFFGKRGQHEVMTGTDIEG